MDAMEKIQLPENIKDGYAVLCYTDEFCVETYPFVPSAEEHWKKNLSKLLDCRIFDKDSEFHMMRGDIGQKFTCRMITDDEKTRDYYDDEQFLDIDDKRSKELFQSSHRVRATRGGDYALPLDSFNDAKAVIRNYISYDSIGQAYISDWRLAGFKYSQPKEKTEESARERS